MPVDPTRCPICRSSGHMTDQGERIRIQCPRCGDLFISGSAYSMIAPDGSVWSDYQRAVISHEVRKMQRHTSLPMLNSDLLSNFREVELPTPSEQADNLVLWLGEQLRKAPGQLLSLGDERSAGIMGCADGHGVHFVVRHLADDGLIHLQTTMSSMDVRLSFAGWNRFERLHRGEVISRTVFMAMPFGNPLLDDVYRTAFKPAVAQTGFELVRLDEAPKAGIIDNHLRVEIRKARFLIAELTDENRGAYWEAGFAEGLGRPVIYTCEQSYFTANKTHFDTNHCQTVIWGAGAFEDAAQRLKDAIRATLPGEAKQTD